MGMLATHFLLAEMNKRTYRGLWQLEEGNNKWGQNVHYRLNSSFSSYLCNERSLESCHVCYPAKFSSVLHKQMWNSLVADEEIMWFQRTSMWLHKAAICGNVTHFLSFSSRCVLSFRVTHPFLRNREVQWNVKYSKLTDKIHLLMEP